MTTQTPSPASGPGSKSAKIAGGVSATVALIFLGLQGGIQGGDPQVASTALLTASTDLKMGNLAALAASISTLMLAASVISVGMVGDRLGRKKVILVAMVVAAAGDVIVALAANPAMYLLGRGITGVGLGAIFAGSFAYVRNFATGKGGISGALGLYSAALGLGALLITFVGASLVSVSWRVAFLLVPIVLIASIPFALRIIPADGPRPTVTAPWDVLGQLLLALGIVGLLYGVSHASVELASPLTYGPIIGGLVLLVVFIWREKGMGANGFFPIRILRAPIFIAAVLAGLAYNLGNGALFLSFSNLFQYDLGLHGLNLSFAQLPYTVSTIVAALIIGQIMGAGKLSREGSFLVMAAIAVVGYLWFAAMAAGHTSSYLAYLVPLILSAVALTIPSLSYGALILASADKDDYGVVSSSRTTIGQFWYALGLAGSTVIIDTLTRGTVVKQLGAEAGRELDQWSVTGQKPAHPEVLELAGHAFGTSFAWMAIVLTIVTVIACVGAFLLLKKAASAPASAAPAPAAS